MGRRSINTTKSGKYMNPTDQARKEARKRELRKNKKQRMLVRTAVLKGKDPFQIIADMERLDQMEYNVSTPPPLNEKVLKDKRRKMKETWDRLCRLYNKEDHERFLELKRMEVEYESKRNQMIKFYESVKSAQEVTIDDIPLPTVPMEPTNASNVNNISSPLSEQSIPQSILKRHSLSSQVCHKSPPGCPPGPPPVLSDFEDDLDEESDNDDDREKSKRIRFSDETPTNDKDSDINEFLKEIEQMEKSVNISENISQTMQSIQSLPAISSHQISSSAPTHSAIPPPPSLRATNVPSGPPPPSLMMFRPQVPPQSAMRSTSQTSNIPGLMVSRPGMPGPPTGLRPGLPPHRMAVPLSSGPRMMAGMRPMPPHPQVNTFTAPPTLSKREDKKTHFISDRATIEAKPQLRNLSADATRFTPVALRVKRDDKVVKKSVPKLGYDTDFKRYANSTQKSGLNGPTKDDAYDQFMKEMENLL